MRCKHVITSHCIVVMMASDSNEDYLLANGEAALEAAEDAMLRNIKLSSKWQVDEVVSGGVTCSGPAHSSNGQPAVPCPTLSAKMCVDAAERHISNLTACATGVDHARAELKQNTEDHSRSPRSSWAPLKRSRPHSAVSHFLESLHFLDTWEIEEVFKRVEFELSSRSDRLRREPTCFGFEESTGVLSAFHIDSIVKAVQTVTEEKCVCMATKSVDELNVAIEAVGGF